MARFREICYDNWKNLKQNFRQGELTLNHVAYWVSIYADRLLILHDKKIDSGLSLKVFNSVPVLTDPVTHRKYIIIPTGVYDLDHDGGIVYISYTYQIDTNAFTQVTFGWTTPESSKRLYWTDEEKPTPDNPYFYRVGNDLFLLGIECIDVTAVEVGLKATFSVCNLDDEMPFPEDLLPQLQIQLLNLGRFILQIPTDRTNEGADMTDPSAMPKTKISAPTEPQTQPQNTEQ